MTTQMNTHPISRGLSVAALATAVALLAGCAAPARVDQMQVNLPMATRTAAATSVLHNEIGIKDVAGGSETTPMWMSKVSSADFERAHEASLKDAGLLSPNRQGSKFQLIATLQKLDQPFMGASLTVTATVTYSLINRATNKEVFSRTYAPPYTAAWNAAFLGTERLRLANEGAIRANIEAFINELLAQNIVGGAGAVSVDVAAG